MFESLTPTGYSDFAIGQRARFLQVALVLTGFAVFVIGLLNLAQDAILLGAYLLVFSVICFLGVLINARGRFQVSSRLFLILILIAIDLDLFDGAALHDPGVAAFPVLILFAGFLHDTKGILFTLGASIISVLGLYYGYEVGWFELNAIPTLNRVAILSILYSVTAGIAWAILISFRKAEENVQDAYRQTIYGLVRALELRDIETLGHAQRVTSVTRQLGAHLGLSRQEIENLELGALLHDIGKLGVKDSILLKPGNLTDEEYEDVKKHTTYAFNVLKNIPRFKDAVDVPHYHHEQWDGKGYPEGLKGEAIPLAARVFSVVDQWDALRSARPYREAWSDEDVKKYIREGAGTRYDPRIAEAFLELLESINLQT